MTCNVCVQHQPVLNHWSNLKFNVKGGNLEISYICETCASKLEDFLKALGWGLTRPHTKGE